MGFCTIKISQIYNYSYISVPWFYDEVHALLGLSNYLESNLLDKNCANEKTTNITINDKESLECKCGIIFLKEQEGKI